MKMIAMLAACAALGFSLRPLAAQPSPHSIPRLPDGKPNLQGVWDHPYVPDMSRDGKDQKGAGELPYSIETRFMSAPQRSLCALRSRSMASPALNTAIAPCSLPTRAWHMPSIS